MEGSSFETLESLAAHLAINITAHLEETLAEYKSQSSLEGHERAHGKINWDLSICLEKPIAIPAAEAACVELNINTDDVPSLADKVS